jgi:DNA polymerase V
VLLQTALKLAEAAFQPGYEYQKAKVIATDLMPADAIQGNWLARPVDGEKPAKLMAAMDRINQTLHQDAIKFGALGLKQPWRMRSAYLSQRYTTHWQELPMVKLCSRPRNRQMSSTEVATAECGLLPGAHHSLPNRNPPGAGRVMH